MSVGVEVGGGLVQDLESRLLSKDRKVKRLWIQLGKAK